MNLRSSTTNGRPVRVSTIINANSDRVWAVISTPGNLENVHPFCFSNPVSAWPGVGAHDEVHYRSGWVYHRHFSDWIDETGYDLDIGATGEETSHVSWRLHPLDDEHTRLTIKVWPRPISRIPGLRQFLRIIIVGPLMRRYLQAVTAGVNWYVINGEPVKEDQFGSHIWFSEKKRHRSSLLA